MTVDEWAKDFRSFINELQMPRDDYRGIMEYIDDALALLKAHGWISVKDRLPEPTEEYTDYIVHIIDDEGNWAIGIAEWDCTLGVGVWKIGPDSVPLPDGMYITHWMETPEPPKEE